MNLNLSSNIKMVKALITANSPVLLVGTAIAGVVATGVLAAKGGYKARGIIDEAELEKGEPLVFQEKFQLTWLCYAAPALTGASTIASTVGVHTIHTKRHAALAGLYAVTTNRLDDYTEKAEEMLGTKKTQQLANDTAQSTIDRNSIENHEVIITGHGQELCFDDLSGRYFMGSMAVIENAINEVNRLILDNGESSLSEFYDFVGLEPNGFSSTVGWSGGDKVEGRFGATVTKDGRPAISVGFRKSPKPNYDRLHTLV